MSASFFTDFASAVAAAAATIGFSNPRNRRMACSMRMAPSAALVWLTVDAPEVVELTLALVILLD